MPQSSKPFFSDPYEVIIVAIGSVITLIIASIVIYLFWLYRAENGPTLTIISITIVSLVALTCIALMFFDLIGEEPSCDQHE